jgi:uncharacterized membrane protein YdjX (TVP38/TMEM64 family)
MKITVVAAVGIAAAAILAFLLVRHLVNQQNHGTQEDADQEPGHTG